MWQRQPKSAIRLFTMGGFQNAIWAIWHRFSCPLFNFNWPRWRRAWCAEQSRERFPIQFSGDMGGRHAPSPTIHPAASRAREGGGGKKNTQLFYTNMLPNHFWSAFTICLIGLGRLSYSWVNMHMFCPYKHTSFCQPAKHIVDYKLTSEPCWQWGSQMNNLSLMVLLQILFWIFHLFSFKTPRSG